MVLLPGLHSELQLWPHHLLSWLAIVSAIHTPASMSLAVDFSLSPHLKSPVCPVKL